MRSLNNCNSGQQHISMNGSSFSETQPAAVPVDAALFSAILSNVSVELQDKAALLLATPVNAAPGIDAFVDGTALTYKDIIVQRTENLATDAVLLFGNILKKYPDSVIRTFSQNPLQCVGSYVSGTRCYSTGAPEFLGVPNVSVPQHISMLIPHLLLAALDDSTFLCEKLDNYELATVYGPTVVTIVPTGGTEYTRVDLVTAIKAKLTNLVSEPVASWDLADEAASMVATHFNAAVVPVPLSTEGPVNTYELLVTSLGDPMRVVPLEINVEMSAIYLGVPATHIIRTTSEKYLNLPDPAKRSSVPDVLVGKARFESAHVMFSVAHKYSYLAPLL